MDIVGGVKVGKNFHTMMSSEEIVYKGFTMWI